MDLKKYMEDNALNRDDIIQKYFQKAKKSLDAKENVYLRINNEELRIKNEGNLK
jgi:hypothetical protein